MPKTMRALRGFISGAYWIIAASFWANLTFTHGYNYGYCAENGIALTFLALFSAAMIIFTMNTFK